MDKGRNSRKKDFIPERLKQAAKVKNMTLLDIANSIEGLEYETLRYYTKTKRIMPDWLVEISSLLEVNPDYILGLTDNSFKPGTGVAYDIGDETEEWIKQDDIYNASSIADMFSPVRSDDKNSPLKLEAYAWFLECFDFPKEDIEELRTEPDSEISKAIRVWLEKSMSEVCKGWNDYRGQIIGEMLGYLDEIESAKIVEVKHGKENL